MMLGPKYMFKAAGAFVCALTLPAALLWCPGPIERVPELLRVVAAEVSFMWFWLNAFKLGEVAGLVWNEDPAANRRALEARIRDRRPFVFYLRCYGPERAAKAAPASQKYMDRMQDAGARGVGFIPLPQGSDRERSIAKHIPAAVPFFALLFKKSINPGPALKVLSDNARWKDDVARAIDAASVVIAFVSTLSEGINHELELLSRHADVRARTWLVLDPAIAAEVRARYPSLGSGLLALSEVPLADDASVTMPAAVIERLEKLAPRAEVTPSAGDDSSHAAAGAPLGSDVVPPEDDNVYVDPEGDNIYVDPDGMMVPRYFRPSA